jgi:hypothetical protein
MKSVEMGLIWYAREKQVQFCPIIWKQMYKEIDCEGDNAIRLY